MVDKVNDIINDIVVRSGVGHASPIERQQGTVIPTISNRHELLCSESTSLNMSKKRPDPQSHSLGYWVYRVNRAMHSAFTARLAVLGVTAAEWTALSQSSRGEMTPVGLAEHMGVDRAAVTRILDQLESKHLIRRTPHPTDGRSTLLELTDQGSTLLTKLSAESRAINERFLKLLPQDEAETLLRLMRKLGEHLSYEVFPLNERDV